MSNLNDLPLKGGNYVVWGLPKGQTDRLYETLLAETPKTKADVEKVKAAAVKDGWHSFRVVIFTDGDRPDFERALSL